jgi:hypothetical protein
VLSKRFLPIVLTLTSLGNACAQSSSTTSSSSSGAVTAGGPTVPQPTIPAQTNSVEGDLLAFKALQSDAEAIAIDIKEKVKGKKVVITSPSDQTISNFQLWRFARLSMKQLDEKTRAMTPKPSPGGGARSS